MLDNFPGFETDNRDELTNILASKFKASRFNIKRFQTRTNWAELKSSQLSVVSYRGDNTEIQYEATPFVRYYAMIGGGGGLAFRVHGKDYELSTKSPYLCMPANTSFKVKSYDDHKLLALRLHIEPLNAFRRKLSRTVVDEAFVTPMAVQDRRARALGQSVRQFADDLDLLGPRGHRDFIQSFERALLAQFVLCTSTSSEAASDDSRSHPSMFQLKKIEDFIASNWLRPVDIGELAEEFDMSARTIFRLLKA